MTSCCVKTSAESAFVATVLASVLTSAWSSSCTDCRCTEEASVATCVWSEERPELDVEEAELTV